MKYKLVVETWQGGSMDDRTFDSMKDLIAYKLAEWGDTDHIISVEEINEDQT